MAWGDGDKVVSAAPKPAAAGGFGADDKVVEKEPSWMQTAVGAVKNLPQSFAANVLEPAKEIMMPGASLISPNAKGGIVDQAKGIGNLVRAAGSFMSDPGSEIAVGLGESVKPGMGKEYEEAQKKEQGRGKKVLGGMYDYYKGRYGSEAGFKKALMQDPLSVAMDASVMLSAGETAAARLPGVAKAGEIASRVAGKVVKAPAEGAAHVMGHLTGGGADAVKQAVKAGFQKEGEFIEALNGKLPPEQTVQMASKAVANMRKERNAQYQAAMKVLGENAEKIEPYKILQAWQDAQKFGHYEGFVTSERSVGLDKKLVDILEDWYQRGQAEPGKFYTPEGIDALKKRVRSIKNNIPFDMREDRAYVGSFEKMLKQQITEQVPVYDKIMKDYAQASEGLEEIERSLSLGDKATYDTGIRKLLSAMRNNANSNYGNRLKMVDKLEEYGAKGLKSRLGGMQMSSGMPRGLAGRNPGLTALGALFDPRLLYMLPAESPYLVGGSLYGLGRGARSFSDMAKAIGPVIPRGAAIESVERAAEDANGKNP